VVTDFAEATDSAFGVQPAATTARQCSPDNEFHGELFENEFYRKLLGNEFYRKHLQCTHGRCSGSGVNLRWAMRTSLTLHEIVAAARGRRRELGLSQSDVAQRLGVSRTWVQAFERETGRASIETVLRLMQVLGLSLDLAKSDAAGDRPDQIDLDELIQRHRQ